jgi:hypothetical protein
VEPVGDGTKRSAFTVATCVLAATPIEFVANFFGSAKAIDSAWLFLLNLGPYLQSAVVLSLLAALRTRIQPDAHSISESTRTGTRVLSAVIGVFAGLAVSLTWWHAIRVVSKDAGLSPSIFDAEPHGGFSPGPVLQPLLYYQYFSVVNAFLMGILGSHLAHGRPFGQETFAWMPQKGSVYDSAWTLWVTWLLVYRLSQFLLIPLYWPGVNLVDELIFDASALFATGLVCFPVSFWLARRMPKTRKSSIYGSQAASFFIIFIATILLFPFGYPSAGVVRTCVLTLNIGGLVWGWAAGSFRWRSLQLQTSAQTTK